MPSSILPDAGHRKPLSIASLVFASYVLLVAAWIFGNPPYAAPDEWSHYLRAVSLGHGQLLGEPAGPEAAKTIVGATRPAFLTEKMYQDELAWVAQTTRQVRIPAGLTPGWSGCAQHDPKISARCLNDSRPFADAREWFNATATYQPFPYLLPAALSRIKADPNNLDRLMRTGKAIVTLTLVAAAVLLLWSPVSGLASLVGIVVAVTPMAVFLAATLNPSGLEIMSALAFGSALLRLTRGDTGYRSAWMIAAASGVVLALSRTQGPLWIALHLCLIAPIAGAGSFVRMTVRQKRYAGPALIAVFGAILLNRLWEYLYGPTLTFDLRPLRSSVYAGLVHLPHVLREQIGVFNYLEFGLPMLAYALWVALALALGIAALLVGTRQQRLLLLVSLAVALGIPVLMFAATMRHTGFGLQGRYVLGLSIVVPLMAGEILVRRYERVRALRVDRLVVLIVLAAGLVQLVAWWTNARRFAVGLDGPWWFLASAEWIPPWGWWPWVILASGGAGLLSAAAIADWGHSRRGARRT